MNRFKELDNYKTKLRFINLIESNKNKNKKQVQKHKFKLSNEPLIKRYQHMFSLPVQILILLK